MKKEDQRINGKNLIQVEEYIKHKWGEDGLEKFRKEAAFHPKHIFEEKEYPFEDYIKFLQSVVDVFGDDQIPNRIGWYRARNLLLAKGRRKVEMDILEKVAAAWGRFNNFGEVTVRQNEGDTTSIVIGNYESDPLYCERMTGFFQGLCDMVEKGGCNVTELKCVCKGDDHCEFSVKRNFCKVEVLSLEVIRGLANF